MFGKKSNLCCGQNAFLSHFTHSLLKACQEINKTLFVQLPTSPYSIQQIPAFSETQFKVKSKRTHRLENGSISVDTGSQGHELHQRLCFHHPILKAHAVKIRFNEEIHIPVKSHPSCQGEAFILHRERGV